MTPWTAFFDGSGIQLQLVGLLPVGYGKGAAIPLIQHFVVMRAYTCGVQVGWISVLITFRGMSGCGHHMGGCG